MIADATLVLTAFSGGGGRRGMIANAYDIPVDGPAPLMLFERSAEC